MTDGKALDRIRKLMALARHNPSGEEARSAALKAVQLIAAHDMVLVAKSEPGAEEADPDPARGAHDVMAAMRQTMRDQFRREQFDAWMRARAAERGHDPW